MDIRNVLIHGGAKVGLHLFAWKVMKSLINNKTRINSALCTHNYKPTFAPPCIYTMEDYSALKIKTFSHLLQHG